MAFYTFPYFFQRFTDSEGLPLAGGSLTFHSAGSAALKNIYLDQSGQKAQNPMPLDSTGLPVKQYFGEAGEYDIYVRDSNGALVTKLLRITALGGSGGADIFPIPVNSGYLHYDISTNTYEWVSIQSDHKISLSENDSADYLPNKLKNTNTIKWGIDGDYLRADIDGQLDTYKVKSTSSDKDPDYLGNKIVDSNTINWEVDGSKLKANVSGELDSYKLKVVQEDTIPHYLEYKIAPQSDSINQTVVNNPNFGKQILLSVREDWINPKIDNRATVVVNDAIDSINFPGKIKSSSSDISGYFIDKIKGGTGIAINTTVDDTNGTILHINATNTTNSKVKVNASDVTSGYLEDKLSAGSGITLTTVDVGGGYRELRIASTALGYQQAARDGGNLLRTTSTIPVDVLSLTLTAGTWEVCGSATGYIQPTGTFNVPGIAVNITTTPGASIGGQIPFDGYDVYAHIRNVSTAMPVSATVSRRRFVLTATTTVYLNAQCRFGEFAYCDFWGNLTARQVA